MTSAFIPSALGRIGGFLPWPSPGRVRAYAAIAAASFVAYILARLLDGPAATGFAAFGVSACGWAWLLTRALFDPAKHDAWWPRVVVFVLTAAGGAAALAPDGTALSGVARNTYALSGSAALLMTFVEPFQRHGCALPAVELRFRAAFLGVFALLVGAAVLMAWSAPARVETACAFAGLIAGLAATAFRLRHPLTRAAPASIPRTASAEDRRLAERVVRLMEDEALHTSPNLRIGDVAARLGQPEYRVSQCIGASLAFANFNRLVNHYRIEQAKRMLAAPDDDRSILEIAFDCGFASLGPFNRAFKAETGATPKNFRAQSRTQLSP